MLGCIDKIYDNHQQALKFPGQWEIPQWETHNFKAINPYYPLVMTNSSPWKDPPFLIGKPSISMGHLYHGYVSHNQRVIGR